MEGDGTAAAFTANMLPFNEAHELTLAQTWYDSLDKPSS
jgi:hypothetical protein